VLALLDDSGVDEAALELSSALAREMRRHLAVVCVQSTRSRVAAELPFTQVLSNFGSQWVPLLPHDLEQAYRAQTARLRELTARITAQHSVSWSLRVIQGNMPGAAIDLSSESDLLLIAAAAPLRTTAATATPRARRRPSVAVVSDGSPAGERALQVAGQLAQALAGTLQIARVDANEKLMSRAQTLATVTQSDVLVLPRTALASRAPWATRCPILWVG
jgi:hypothetical protein